MTPAAEPGSLGAYLCARREQAGVPLDEISRVTRIPQQHLVALESDDFSALPPPVFVKGFIRAYADVVGMPPDTALALYHAQSGMPAGVPRTVSRPQSAASWVGHPLTVSLVLLLLFGAGVLALNALSRDPAPAPHEPQVLRELHSLPASAAVSDPARGGDAPTPGASRLPAAP